MAVCGLVLRQTQDPIVIDRFDGRALLDDRSKFIKLKSRRRGAEDDDASAEEAILDKERFRDLEQEDDVSGPSAQGSSPPQASRHLESLPLSEVTVFGAGAGQVTLGAARPSDQVELSRKGVRRWRRHSCPAFRSRQGSCW